MPDCILVYRSVPRHLAKMNDFELSINLPYGVIHIYSQAADMLVYTRDFALTWRDNVLPINPEFYGPI